MEGRGSGGGGSGEGEGLLRKRHMFVDLKRHDLI